MIAGHVVTGLAVAAAGAGLYLLLTDMKADERVDGSSAGGRLTVAPMVGQATGGLSVGGRF